MKTIVLLALMGLFIANPALPEDTPVNVKPAVNTPAADEKPGVRPYEMADRKEERTPLVNFQDLTGWTVEQVNSAKCDLTLSREQKMWGDYVAKLTYTGKADNGAAIIRPPKPIPIKDTFDCMNMWVFGNLWEWAPEPGTPFLNISILLRDKDDKEQTIPLTRLRWKEWWLTHKKLGQPMESASLAGIKFDGINNAEARSIYLGPLYTYKEDLKPLEFEPRPARNLTLMPGQDQGLNATGKGRLPFPTREETILPSNFAEDYSVSLNKTAEEEWAFLYKGRDGEIKYIYKPKTGSLGEIEVYMDGRKAALPMTGGGIELNGKAITGKLVETKRAGDDLHLFFHLGDPGEPILAEYVFRIWQKSLVMDFICRGGISTGLALGNLSELETKPAHIQLPYVCFAWQAKPRIAFFGDKTRPRFASVWVDWYRSNGSELWTEQWANENAVKINGGVRYNVKTNGKRNDLYERVFLTVSHTFEEVLPTIANPPSSRGKQAGERLWQESWGPESYAKEMERSRKLRSYGIDMLTQCNHEITWRDGGESFTLRTKAAPGRGGDKALQEYVAHQKSLGWLSGLYTNYTDFAPVNEHWSEDYVQLTPEGEWRPAWPRNYALKPSRAVELDAKLAPQVKKKFGSTAAYTDVQTAVSPWAYCDYDARVPGAGTFAATFYAYGELLLNDQKVYGPTWSEGTYHWLYAGLASGNYGLCYDGVDLSKEPLNVAFELMKMHPLECDMGVPWMGGFFKEAGWDKPESIDASVDHFIAATIAYGHIGYLVEESHGIERACRSYYMLQQLQKRCAMQRPARIEYSDADGKLISVSQAIAQDVLKLSRLHVVYENGLELYVNGSQDIWTITDPEGKPIQLPSWGWCAWDKNGEFIEYSASIDGHRLDYVKSPEYEYLDGRGVLTTIGGISVKGSVAVRRGNGRIEVIDIHGNEEIGIETGSERCAAYDAENKSLGEAKLRRDGKFAHIALVKEARKYVLSER